MKGTLIIIILVAAGCATESRTGAKDELPLNSPVSARLHQVLESPAAGVSLVFDSVVNDSRCPVDVQCIWSGNAAVKLKFTSLDTSSTFVLNTNIDPKDTLVSGYRIKLVRLSPEPNSTSSINPGDYIPQVLITKE